METKRCSKCKQEKDIGCFYKDRHRKDGLHQWCRECCKAYDDIYRKTHERKDRIRQREAHRKSRSKYNGVPKLLGDANFTENKQVYMQVYRVVNREGQNAYQREYRRKKRMADATFGFMLSMRSRVSKAIRKQGGKRFWDYDDLYGCTHEFLFNHIQSMFTGNMSWDNYGLGLGRWSIDHIIPCASFDLSDPAQQKICFHYTNLQPMWSIENSRKGARVNMASAIVCV